MRSAKPYSLILLTLVIGASSGAVIASRISVSPSLNAASSADTPALAAGVPMDTSLFSTIARRENPVVVSVTTRSRVRGRDPHEDFFRWFFGDRPVPHDRVQRALGSGFLISQAGEILTNNHVVAGAEVIEVGLFGDEPNTYRALTSDATRSPTAR